MSLFIETINTFGGVISYNDFDINEEVPFEDQVYSYKQDILQITFGERYTLDVGWYPEFDPKGYFWVRSIKDFDWMQPLDSKKCYSLSELKIAIEDMAKVLSQKVNNLE